MIPWRTAWLCVLGWPVAAAAATVTPPAAASVSLPTTREGLWDVRIRTVAKPSNARTETQYKLCRDVAVERDANELWSHVRGCTVSTEALSGSRFAIKTRCVTQGKAVLTQGTVSYQGVTARHSETRITYQPAIGGKTGANSIADERWVGPCPAPLRPGDRMDPDGQVHPPGK